MNNGRNLAALTACIFISLAFFSVASNAGAVTAEDAFRRAQGGDVLIEVVDSGLTQPEYRMKVRQGMLFILNNSADSLLTFEFDFGNEGPSCYTSITPNMAFKDGGKLVSTRALEPGNFASTCLPNIGEFEFKIFGLAKHPEGVKGKLIISLM